MLIEHTQELDKFAVIIGEDVSLGARSPLLWNRGFNGIGINAKMLPVDAKDSVKAKEILDALLVDERFLGGAVAAPLKMSVAEYLNTYNGQMKDVYVDPVNCFYRKADGSFEGVNTDVLAAIETIKQFRSLADLKIIHIHGNGAVAWGVAKELRKTCSAEVKVFRRSENLDNKFLEIGCKVEAISQIETLSPEASLIINCTSVGKDGETDECLLSQSHVANLDEGCLIFDVNYINGPSKLIRIAQNVGLDCTDGKQMNLLQAVIAFSLATGTETSNADILSLMEST